MNNLPFESRDSSNTGSRPTVVPLTDTEFTQASIIPPLEATKTAALKEKYPSLANTDGVIFGNYGGDAIIGNLRPGQADEIIKICKELDLRPPRVESDGADINFCSDSDVRDRVAFLIGLIKVTDIARDPDFRTKEDHSLIALLKKSVSLFLPSETPTVKTYIDVATEMENIVGDESKRRRYMTEWYHELLINSQGVTGAHVVAHDLLNRHLRGLMARELLEKEDLKKWQPLFVHQGYPRW